MTILFDHLYDRSNISTAIKALALVGAKNMLLVNLLDIGKTPLASAVNHITPPNVVSTAVEAHNQLLKEMAWNLDPKVHLILFDVKSIVDDAIANHQKYGFTNTTQGCSVVGDTNSDEYVFWDQVHLTSKANQLIANAALETLQTICIK